MRSRILPVLIALLVMSAVVSIATADQGSVPVRADATPGSCDGLTVKFHKHRAFSLIEKGHDRKRFPDKTPMKGSEKRALSKHKLCIQIEKIRDQIEERRDNATKVYESFYKSEKFRIKYTPYYFGEPGLEYVAIPPYIVECETNGYYGEERWNAANPSGAYGPYQIMAMHGRPAPVNSEADKRQHHKIAAHLWATGGESQWECA
jgi:hypothetical protein